MSKRETLDEYLARGGKITKIAAQPIPEAGVQTAAATTGGSGLMTLTDGSLYYSDAKPRVVKKKEFPAIHLAALPPHLLRFVPKR
jgi:hypothetical protein